MILDHELSFALGQVVTASAPSQNVVDTGIGRNIGLGTHLFIVFDVQASAAAAGAATVNFVLQESDDEAFTSPVVISDSGAIPKATLVTGYELVLAMPQNIQRRYLRVMFNVGTGPLTAGTFGANIVDGPAGYKAYPAGNF